MPTYQYACTECGGQLEAVQKFTDEPLTVHESCGGKLRKVYSAVGIVFKGSGFYRTDSRNSPPDGSSPDSSSSSKADSSSDSGSSNSDSPKKPSSSDSSPSKTGSSSSSSSSGEKVA
ncbi:MAG: FmdB family transcriptional regulator [Nocardiopsaceae bacterium]|nr:FmdB family transcriptional regulator [Nocardiopsaceae bacterium]